MKTPTCQNRPKPPKMACVSHTIFLFSTSLPKILSLEMIDNVKHGERVKIKQSLETLFVTYTAHQPLQVEDNSRAAVARAVVLLVPISRELQCSL